MFSPGRGRWLGACWALPTPAPAFLLQTFTALHSTAALNVEGPAGVGFDRMETDTFSRENYCLPSKNKNIEGEGMTRTLISAGKLQDG